MYDGTCAVIGSRTRTEYVYDSGRLISGLRQYEYGPDGLVKIIDGIREHELSYTDGRVTRIEVTYDGIMESLAHLAYDDDGRIVQIDVRMRDDDRELSWTRRFHYSGAELVSETSTLDGGRPKEKFYRWENGRLIEHGARYGTKTAYTYDEQGHLRGLLHDEGGPLEFELEHEIDERGRRGETSGEQELRYEYDGTFGPGAVCGERPRLPGLPRIPFKSIEDDLLI